MTYTVKNGTWCKDNDKEYYSCTLAGLRAARAAGEIPEGTRVVIHEPKYNPGDLVKSFNPNCPEGCFVPDGSAFDTDIYKELAEVFPDGNLPDLRECVLVMVGRSDRPEITNHDEYSAGEFKNDTAAIPEHTHTVHVNDPGHGHNASVSINDPGHGHTVSDPGHGHTVSDPGHKHGRGDMEITGSINNLNEGFGAVGSCTGAFSKGVGIDPTSAQDTDSSPSGSVTFKASNSWTGKTENVSTGVSVSSSTTGVSVSGNTTGISANASVDGNTTGINVTIDPAAGAGDTTHGKQVGVYYYIAF